MANYLRENILDRIRGIRWSKGLKEGWRENRENPLFSNSPYAYVAHETMMRKKRNHKQQPDDWPEFVAAFEIFESKTDVYKTQKVREWGEAIQGDPDMAAKVERWLGLDAQEPDEPENSMRSRLRSRGPQGVGANSEESESEVEGQDPPAPNEPSPVASHASPGDGRNPLSAYLRNVNIPGWEAGQKVIDIPMQAINWLVPPRLASSVVRKPHSKRRDLNVASVDLEFGHKDGQEKCSMYFQICKEATARYAIALFGVQIEERDGVCFVRHNDSHARITGVPQLQLTDCHRDCLNDEFGSVLANAIKEHPKYKEEDALFELFTRTVCMYIPTSLEKERVEIMLELGYDAGEAIMNRLMREEDEWDEEDEEDEDMEEYEDMEQDEDMQGEEDEAQGVIVVAGGDSEEEDEVE